MDTQEKTRIGNGSILMPKFIKYRVAYTFFPQASFEFKPEDVEPYYEIYDNGDMIFFIKQKYKFLGLFNRTRILEVSDQHIDVSVYEYPVKVKCSPMIKDK